MRFVLITPETPDIEPDGSRYCHGLVAGLHAAGHGARLIELPEATACFDAASRAWTAIAPDEVPVIDAPALPAFLPLAEALATRQVAGLTHQLDAMEPDLRTAADEAVRAAERQLLPCLARVVASSGAAERLAVEAGVDPHRVAIVTPGLEPLQRAAGSGGPGCAVLAVGALLPRKGHDVLIRALARLSDLDWTLTIIGGGENHLAHAAALHDLVHALALGDRVRLPGNVTPDALAASWHHADLFALATHLEGYPLALAQALRRGLPVAVTAPGGVEALLPAGAGVVCPPGDVDGLSKAMRRVIFDHGLRATMAEAAWQAGRALPDWAQQATRFVRLFDPG